MFDQELILFKGITFICVPSWMPWKQLQDSGPPEAAGHSNRYMFSQRGVIFQDSDPPEAAGHSNRYMFSQKDVTFQDSDPPEADDTAAPSFEVANAPYMQYKRHTLKKNVFPKWFPWSPKA